MSADNGIYIVKFPDGYRVAEAGAIENIDYFPEGSKECKEELKSYFGKSKVYKTLEEVRKRAFELEEEVRDGFGYTEYGICSLGEYESFE